MKSSSLSSFWSLTFFSLLFLSTMGPNRLLDEGRENQSVESPMVPPSNADLSLLKFFFACDPSTLFHLPNNAGPVRFPIGHVYVTCTLVTTMAHQEKKRSEYIDRANIVHQIFNAKVMIDRGDASLKHVGNQLGIVGNQKLCYYKYVNLKRTKQLAAQRGILCWQVFDAKSCAQRQR